MLKYFDADTNELKINSSFSVVLTFKITESPNKLFTLLCFIKNILNFSYFLFNFISDD